MEDQEVCPDVMYAVRVRHEEESAMLVSALSQIMALFKTLPPHKKAAAIEWLARVHGEG